MIRMGIVGTGGMANGHAAEYAKMRGVSLRACYDISRERAAEFGQKHAIPRVCDTMDDLLGEVDAVSIAASDAAHVPLSVQAFKARRHVLCEKPLATSFAEAVKGARAAVASKRIHMVNFSYRRSSAFQKAIEMVRRGDLGRVLNVESWYLQSWLAQDGWGDWRTKQAFIWRLQKAAGSGGVLGDIGCHILDMTTAVAGSVKAVQAFQKVFDKGIPGNRINGLKLDAPDSFSALLRFRDGAVGTCSASRWATGHANSLLLKVHGDEGSLMIDLDRSWTELYVCPRKALKACRYEPLVLKPAPTVYERFVRSIRTGKNDQPDFVRGAEVQACLDACERSADEDGSLVAVPAVKV